MSKRRGHKPSGSCVRESSAVIGLRTQPRFWHDALLAIQCVVKSRPSSSEAGRGAYAIRALPNLCRGILCCGVPSGYLPLGSGCALKDSRVSCLPITLSSSSALASLSRSINPITERHGTPLTRSPFDDSVFRRYNSLMNRCGGRQIFSSMDGRPVVNRAALLQPKNVSNAWRHPLPYPQAASTL